MVYNYYPCSTSLPALPNCEYQGESQLIKTGGCAGLNTLMDKCKDYKTNKRSERKHFVLQVLIRAHSK